MSLAKDKKLDKPRIRTLDSLRGLAALSVVFCHFTDKMFSPALLSMPFFNIVRYGHGAVMFFFVLSGYVLVYQYASNPSYTFRRFLTQRIVRIYVPYIVALLLALLLFSLCKHTHYQKAWLSQMWPVPLSTRLFVDHILLIGNFETEALLPPMWSLVHEMRVSLLFPILLFLLRLKPGKALIGSGVLFLIGVVTTGLRFNESAGYYNAYTYTIYYLVVFLVGGAVATYQQTLLTGYAKLTAFFKGAFLIIALLLYNYADIIFSSIFTDASKMHPVIYACGKSITEDGLITFASCYFIIAAISAAGKQTFLEKKLPLFLGKISYSLYLVHTSVGGFIYYTLYGKMPVVSIIIICFMASFIVAYLFNKYVEMPSMKVAKSLMAKKKTE